MAKRGGKAASRRSRQRAVRRPAPPPRPAPTPDATSLSAAAASGAATERSATLSEPRAERRAPPTPERVYGSSVLSQRAQDEYHYVARDLRNIGVLTLVIALLLALAFVLFRVVGLGA